MNAKRLLALLLAALLVLSMAACASGTPADSKDTPKTDAPKADDAAQTPAADETDLTQIECTLDFPSWQATEPGFAEFWEYAIGKFNETYPKVTINLYQVPFDNYIDTLTTMYAAKNPPAITHLPSANFNQFQDMGWFENLDSYFAQTDIPETWTKMQDCMQVDGSNYGLLLLGNAYSLFYNEAMLNEAGVSVPTTPEELLDAARKLTLRDESGNITQWGFGTTSTTASGMYTGATQFVIGEGSRWCNEDGSLNFDDPKLKQALTDFKTIFDENLTPLGVTEEQKREYFAEGKIAMISDGPWVVSLINDAAEDVRSNVKVTSLPFGTLSGKASNSVHIAASLDETTKALVWEFYKILASAEAQTMYAKCTGSPAPRAGAITEEVAAQNPFLTQMADDANNAVSVVPLGYEKTYSEFTALVIDALVNLTSDPNNSVDDMLTSLAKEIQDTIG